LEQLSATVASAVGDVLFDRSTVLVGAIRRDILSALAESDTMTVPAATAEVAADWSARRRRCGDSRASVLSAASLIFQVGADLHDEFDAQPSAAVPGHSRHDA
jgi:hypothetical protein